MTAPAQTKTQAPALPQLGAAPVMTQTGELPQAAKPMVSDETRSRWRVMLANQISQGKNYDLGQLVETVVSRICDEQSQSIGACAKGMAEIDAVRESIRAEFMRGKEVIDKPGGEALRAPFNGNTVQRVTGAEQQQLQLKKGQANSTMTRSHVAKLVKNVPLESLIYTRKVLVQHLDRLAKQDAALQQERGNLDTRMKKALDERTRIVTNLASVSKELYVLAKEVAAELPQRAPSAPAQAAPKPATQAPAKVTQPAAAAKPAAAAPAQIKR
jgi:hypothetical protein